MIHIELRPEIEAQLAAEAQARGMALDAYVAEKLGVPWSAGRTERGSVAEAIDRIRELRRGNRLGDIEITELIREGRKH